jgi:hypothetical protein
MVSYPSRTEFKHQYTPSYASVMARRAPNKLFFVLHMGFAAQRDPTWQLLFSLVLGQKGGLLKAQDGGITASVPPVYMILRF